MCVLHQEAITYSYHIECYVKSLFIVFIFVVFVEGCASSFLVREIMVFGACCFGFVRTSYRQ